MALSDAEKSWCVHHVCEAKMRKFLMLMLLGMVVAGAAGVVYAAKIKVGTAVTFPVDIYWDRQSKG
mgnify:CR=1 FL=1